MPGKEQENSTDLKRGRFALFTIALCVVAMSLASYIRFPAGDSWTHGWTVEQWLKGNFVLNDWASAVALPQQIFGWVIHIGAENVSWSRLAVLTALVTMVGCVLGARLPSRLYPQYKELHDWAPLFAIIMIAPTFSMKIAAGFMTDGYYLFFMTASLYMLAGVLADNKDQTNAQRTRKWIGFATLATLAALQRTHGVLLLLIVPIWVLLTRIVAPDKNKSGDGIGAEGSRWWLPVILSVIGLIFSLWVLSLKDFAPARSSEVTSEMLDFWTGQLMSWPGLIKDRLWLIFGILQHFGLAVLPISILTRYRMSRLEKESSSANGKKRKVINYWYVIFGAIFIAGVFACYFDSDKLGVAKLFPYLGNSLTDEGFGPRAATLAMTAHHELSTTLRVILTILGSIGGLNLIWLISRMVRLSKINWRSPVTLFGIIGLAHLFLILVNIHFFDRYLLPLIPFVFIWLTPVLKDINRRQRIFGWVLTCLFLIFSIWGTADFLRWTGAKWDIANQAHAAGIQPNEIVCGYEPDGYFNFTNQTYRELNSLQRFPGDIWWVDRLGLMIGPEYVVFEKGADRSNSSMWAGYVPTEIENDVMQVLVNPALADLRSMHAEELPEIENDLE